MSKVGLGAPTKDDGYTRRASVLFSHSLPSLLSLSFHISLSVSLFSLIIFISLFFISFFLISFFWGGGVSFFLPHSHSLLNINEMIWIKLGEGGLLFYL